MCARTASKGNDWGRTEDPWPYAEVVSGDGALHHSEDGSRPNSCANLCDRTFGAVSNKASEALGIWTATSPDTALDLNLEGSFGATRRGSVTTPSLPRLTDDGGEVDADTRTVLGSTGFTVDAVSTDVPDDDDTITQSSPVLGMTYYGADLLALGTCQEACVCFLALTGRTGSEAGVERDWDESRDPAERGRAEAAGRRRQRRRSREGFDSLDQRRCAWLPFWRSNHRGRSANPPPHSFHTTLM